MTKGDIVGTRPIDDFHMRDWSVLQDSQVHFFLLTICAHRQEPTSCRCVEIDKPSLLLEVNQGDPFMLVCQEATVELFLWVILRVAYCLILDNYDESEDRLNPSIAVLQHVMAPSVQ